jgi:hypothetical protein
VIPALPIKRNPEAVDLVKKLKKNVANVYNIGDGETPGVIPDLRQRDGKWEQDIKRISIKKRFTWTWLVTGGRAGMPLPFGTAIGRGGEEDVPPGSLGQALSCWPDTPAGFCST